MNNNEKFAKSVYTPAFARLIEMGKNSKDADIFARLVVSQAAQESGWGTRPSGKNNYFGIKATASQPGTMVATHEGYGANRIAITDKFVDYDTSEEGISAAVDRLNSKFHAFDGPATPEAFIDSIKKYGYFTDSRDNYLNKIKSILDGPTVAKALANSKHVRDNMPIIPQQVIPTLTHPNDATRVAKPLVPPFRLGGKVITSEMLQRVHKIIRRSQI